jgi:enoyl-CoA hydratase/carnithine racemase
MTGTARHEDLGDGIARLTFDRPPMNAMDIEFLETIGEAFEALDEDDSWRALIITGEGRALSAGLDLKQLPSLDVEDQDRLCNGLNRAFAGGYRLMRPVVTAVNGHALAGGFFWVLLGDYRIAVDQGAQFGLTEVKVGVSFPIGGLEIAQAELAPKSFRTMLETGETFGPDEALARGIVDELVPAGELPARAEAKARELAALPPNGFANVKRQVRGPVLDRIDRAVAQGDPALGGWVSDEARAAAQKILSG